MSNDYFSTFFPETKYNYKTVAGNDYDSYRKQIEDDLNSGCIVAFTDGSFDARLNKYSYGVVIIDFNRKEHKFSGVGNNVDFITARNVAGEVLAVITALEWATINNYKKIKIYHDYVGVASWADGSWRAKTPISNFYTSKLKSKYKKYLDFKFVKVKGHSGVEYNEVVDKLAKLALFDNKCFPLESTDPNLYNDINETTDKTENSTDIKVDELDYRGFHFNYFRDDYGQQMYTYWTDGELLSFGSFNMSYKEDTKKLVDEQLDTIFVFDDFSIYPPEFCGAKLEYFFNGGHRDIRLMWRNRIMSIFLQPRDQKEDSLDLEALKRDSLLCYLYSKTKTKF